MLKDRLIASVIEGLNQAKFYGAYIMLDNEHEVVELIVDSILLGLSNEIKSKISTNVTDGGNLIHQIDDNFVESLMLLKDNKLCPLCGKPSPCSKPH